MTNTVKINFENTDIMNLFSNIVDAIAQKIEDYPSIEKGGFSADRTTGNQRRRNDTA